MTIVVALKVSSGVVLAADSRLTIQENGQLVFLSDSNLKLFGVQGHALGILTCGSSFLEGRAVASWLEDFAARVAPTLADMPTVISALTENLPPPDQGSITYLLAGFARPSGGRQATLGDPLRSSDTPAARGADAQIFKVNHFSSGETQRFDLSSSAIFWDGEFEALTRLVLGFAPAYAGLVTESLIDGQGQARVPYYAFSLQEGVEYVEFLATTQVHFQRFASGPQTCGGPIDIAVITPESGFQWVRRKDIPPYNYLG
ncbi:MAG: hypothetical protein KME03_08225 [Aphanocapsa lilacina HA4352-LM1]|jgi:hypothetical protein|nr:hypothetical protein [Aphanocapsa lilacina HA4352-LM1]